ncbi:AGAP010830-PA-like protein [Anopheles sinensis]|uniref:AGAP010830-PA-like protein n=1 Tax=Anopheles sinensis TaxID=74873 RepID=A0A084VE72_ANOSI|nr:AGAP010830-PA-like protein [Anopheles sinensis]
MLHFHVNPLGNVTREWSEAPLNVGVFDGDFQLSAIPTLGPYHVTATVKGERLVSETFEVQDYVPTHIDVEVRLNSIPVLEDQGLNLTVSAKYPLGQPARGTARLDLYIEGDVLDQTKTVSMNGMANLQISFFKPPVILEEEHNVRLKVTFTDDLTSKSYPILRFKPSCYYDAI